MKYILASFFSHIVLFIIVSHSIKVDSQNVVWVDMYTNASSEQAPVKTKIKAKAKQSAPQQNGLNANEQNKQPAPVVQNESALQNSDTTNLNLPNDAGTQNVMGHLISLIYKNKIYPYESIRLKQQGHVTLIFKINQNGEVTEVQILQGSAYKLLNQAAVQTLQNIKSINNHPQAEALYNRRYSFTFEYVINSSAS